MFVELDGVALSTNSSATWKYTRGVAPYTLTVEVDESVANELMDASTRYGSTLVLGTGTERLEVQKLTILGTSPSSVRGIVKLSIADRRWTFPYQFVARRYNVRRKTPNKRRRSINLGPTGKLPSDVANAVQQVDDDIAYAPWSIKEDGLAFTGADIIRDVLSLVTADGPGWTEERATLNPSLPDVEGLELNAQGDTALSRVLSAMGGLLDVYVNAAGELVVYNVQSGREFIEVGLGTRGVSLPIVGRPLVAVQDNRKRRPSKFVVLFEKSIEGRIDFREGDDEKAAQAQITKGNNADPEVPIVAHNVFPMPENGTIPATGGRGERFVLRGTWVTLADLLAYYKANKGGNDLSELRPLSRNLIRRLWLSNRLNVYAASRFDKGGLWARRIAVIRQHYRSTYQIQKPWLDRFKKIEAFRVAMDDPETGGRVPAPSYFDYSVKIAADPSVESDVPASEEEMQLVQLRRAIEPPPSASILPGTGIIDTEIESMNPAPATVTVVDSDLGTIGVKMDSDFSELTDSYLRSAVNELEKPTAYGHKTEKSRAGRLFLLQDQELSPAHEVSILLTFIMGAPNDSRRFFKLEVSTEEAAKFLPSPTFGTEDKGEGPVQMIRVGAPRVVARYAWNDDLAENFYKTFSSDPEFRLNDAGERVLAVPDIGTPINLDELQSYAQAVCAREVARHRDHPEGALNTDFNPAAVLTGSISSVSHEFTSDKDGGALTSIELMPETPPLDPSALLTKDVRRVVEGFVDNSR